MAAFCFGALRGKITGGRPFSHQPASSSDDHYQMRKRITKPHVAVFKGQANRGAQLSMYSVLTAASGTTIAWMCSLELYMRLD